MSESNHLIDGPLHGKYRILRIIGQGGFGRTFLAEDITIANEPLCVIKQFFVTNNSDQAAELFRLEAQRLKELGNHPQIPKLLEYFESTGDRDDVADQYIIQEFIDGQNLEQELAQNGVFTEADIRSLLNDLLPILQFVHQHQVIHRDIKPSNIIRRRDRTLVLVDFGAAKYAASETVLAKTGTTIGSAEYVAPEQAMGKAVFQSDLYSLGVTCIHLLTQIPPFDLMDYGEGSWIWRDFLLQPISEQLGSILDKLLQRGTKIRYQSTAEVLADLATKHKATLTLVVENKRHFLSSKTMAVAVAGLITVGTGVGATLFYQQFFEDVVRLPLIQLPQNTPHTYKSPDIKHTPNPRSPEPQATQSSKVQVKAIIPTVKIIVQIMSFLIVATGVGTALQKLRDDEEPHKVMTVALTTVMVTITINVMVNLAMPDIEQATTGT